jgi:hypothetical protein
MIVAATPAATAQDDAQARTVAQEVLDRGAALFDARDAAAMAATFLDDAEIALLKRESDSARVTIESAHGKAAIEKGYADIFKDRDPAHRARNTVETARFLGPDTLLISGRFALDRDQGDLIRFVQIRVREGDAWKVATMQLMVLPR